jgi:hypothetical protein
MLGTGIVYPHHEFMAFFTMNVRFYVYSLSLKVL